MNESSEGTLREVVARAIAGPTYGPPAARHYEAGDDVLATPEMQAIRAALAAQAASLSVATQGNWNDSPAEVLSAQGLPAHVIEWVLS